MDTTQLTFSFDRPPIKTAILPAPKAEQAVLRPTEDKPQTNHISEADFFKMFDKFADLNHQATHRAFEDFCFLGTCIVHNLGMQEPLLSAYMPQFEKRHQEYLERAKSFNQEQVRLLLEMIKALAELLDKKPDDYLGRYFGQMGFDKHFHGQFFTPVHVCGMMAKMTYSEQFAAEIAQKGYASLCEPACGSGAMIIGVVQALQDYKIDHIGAKLLIHATDIDRLCVNMAYLQLGILGLSARIVHGNTITMETWDTFDTPNLQINKCLGRFC